MPGRCDIGLPAITAQLLFGRALKGGGEVDGPAWQAFLASAVTPRFPDGLTVLEGNGQWRQPATGRIVAEHSTVVVIVAEASAKTSAGLEAIRAEYRRRFDQQSVGLVVNPSCADF